MRNSTKHLRYALFMLMFVLGQVQASGIEGSPLSIYENNFMLGGVESSPYTNDYAFKFQISAKLKILNSPLYLAYTQRSFMDLGSYSIPFYDHNFRPEIFYVFNLHRDQWVKAIQLGLSHQSNGKEGEDSRSWNNAYLMIYLQKGGFYVHPKIWVPFLIAGENSDLVNYYGLMQWDLGYIWDNKIELSTMLNIGRSFNKYSIESNFSVPCDLVFRGLKGQLITAFWLQTYWGYGETLLGYKQLTRSVGLGVGIRG